MLFINVSKAKVYPTGPQPSTEDHGVRRANSGVTENRDYRGCIRLERAAVSYKAPVTNGRLHATSLEI
jgi:hypothetical protein